MFSKICVVRIEGGFIACVKDLRLPYWVGPTAPPIFTHLHRFNLIRRHQNWMKNPIKMYPKTTMARLPKHYIHISISGYYVHASPRRSETQQMRTRVSKSHVGSHVVTNVVPCVVPCGHMCGHIVVHQTCQTPKFMPCSVKYLLTMCIMYVSMLICINFVLCVYWILTMRQSILFNVIHWTLSEAFFCN